MSYQLLINIGYLLILLFLGYVFGRRAEAKHYRAIERREQQFLALPTTSGEELLADLSPDNTALVRGSVVISVDYFKRMLAALRAFFGGEVQAYETLLDRARREAILRMKESCPEAAQIINLRVETSSIYRGAGTVGSVEVLAYGTAVFPQGQGISTRVVRAGPTG
ncbi:MAG: YbjQ family protein [Granulosicoccaceae bacterium]